MNEMMMDKKCPCPHHKMVPLLVILFAFDFLLGSLGYLSSQFVSVSWPVLVIAGVLTKALGHKCKCCQAPMQAK